MAPAIPPVPTSYPASVSTIPVALPGGAVILSMSVRLNITHAYVGDVVAVLKAQMAKCLTWMQCLIELITPVLILLMP